MLDKLLSLKSHENTVVILRHADRGKIPVGEFGHDIMLNNHGIENALKFGQSIRGINVVRIVSSPVPRCIQTAEHILLGLGKNLPIHTSVCLGNPGLHIADAEEAGSYLLKHGAMTIYQQYTRGEDVPGMPSMESFRQEFIRFAEEETREDGLTLMISHDFLIAVADFVLNSKIYDPEAWVNYLEGIILNEF